MLQRFIHDDKENADPNGLPEVPDFSDIPDLMELIEEPSGGVLSDDGTVILDEFFQTGITEELQNWITDEYSESDEYLYEDPGNQNNLPELNEKISEETRLFKNRDFTCSDDLSKFIDKMRGLNFCCTGRRNKLSTLFNPDRDEALHFADRRDMRRSRPKWTVFSN